MIRFLFKLVYRLIIFLAVIILAVGIFRTHRTQNGELHDRFIAGTLPDPPLHGQYETSIGGYTGSWEGQIYSAFDHNGSNIFGVLSQGTKRWNFVTKTGESNRDEGVAVLLADYDVPGNPFWVKPVEIEIVEVGQNEYLGKINYRLIPAYDFAIAYYTLTVPKVED